MTSDRDCDDIRGNGETSGGSSGAVPHLAANGNGHRMPVAAFQNIFELMINSLPQLVWRADPQGEIDYLSDQWYAETGLRRTREGGTIDLERHWRSAIHEEDAAGFLAVWKASVGAGTPFEAECRVQRAEKGYGWHLCRATPVFERGGRVVGWYGTSTYVDKQKQERDNLYTASHAKDRFLAMLSHELRTPLTPCLLTIAELEADPSLPAHMMESMKMLRRNIEHEERLVGDLVDLSAGLHGKLLMRCEVVDLHKAVLEVAEACRGELDAKQVVLTFGWKSLQLPVVADPVRLRQVIWNLLRNAIKFVPASGGKIEIGATEVSENQVRMWVKDNGIGIAPHALSRLFLPFEQADASTARKYGGLGLGLAIAKNIAELHQGSLFAVSDGLGHGSTFVLELPILPPSRLPGGWAELGSEETATELPPLRILLVEDHLDTASAMRRLLQSFGHTVTCVNSGAAGLDAVRQTQFGLILSDVRLPDAMGWDFLRELRKICQTPAIAISGWASVEDVLRALDAGFQEYLVKPVRTAALRRAIQLVLAQLER